jgi:hypothetical protein
MERMGVDVVACVVERAATVGDVVKMGNVSRLWRNSVYGAFTGWLRRQPLGTCSEWLSFVELTFVRRFVDGLCFPLRSRSGRKVN